MTLAAVVLLVAAMPLAAAEAPVAGTGSVVFLHPDGTGLAHWDAARLLLAGPDGTLHWDRLPAVGLYRGHLKDALAATSNGGGTVHTFGVKAGTHAVGAEDGKPLASASGRPVSIMREALAAALGRGDREHRERDRRRHRRLPRLGGAAEGPRGDRRQMAEAGPDVLLGGGEAFFLPEGVAGRHGPGRRTGGRNLVEELRRAGYHVVTTRDELLAVPPGATRLLGLFAEVDTFSGEPEEALRAAGRPAFDPAAPTYAEMLRAALAVLSRSPRRFLLVAEEEAGDNFGNVNNAPGALEAMGRADEGIGVALEHLARHPATLVLTAADSGQSRPRPAGRRSPFRRTVARGRRTVGQDGRASPRRHRANGRTSEGPASGCRPLGPPARHSWPRPRRSPPDFDRSSESRRRTGPAVSMLHAPRADQRIPVRRLRSRILPVRRVLLGRDRAGR